MLLLCSIGNQLDIEFLNSGFVGLVTFSFNAESYACPQTFRVLAEVGRVHFECVRSNLLSGTAYQHYSWLDGCVMAAVPCHCRIHEDGIEGKHFTAQADIHLYVPVMLIFNKFPVYLRTYPLAFPALVFLINLFCQRYHFLILIPELFVRILTFMSILKPS